MILIYQAKLFLQHATSFSMDELHVLLGLGLQLLLAGFLRSRVSHWRPWLVVLAVELANEANDLFVERWPQPGMQYGEGMKDIISTMILPTLLMVTARHYPGLFSAPVTGGAVE